MIKKSAILLFALAIIAFVSLIILSLTPRSQAQFGAEQPVRPQLSEEQIRQNVSRVKADLRTMATANEAYFFDNKAYTDNLPSLTTPVCYITSIPNDPFSPTTASLKFGYPTLSKLAIYSVGPDGMDNFAQFDYDPTNGSVSTGDVRRDLEHPFYSINIAELSEKMQAQQMQLDFMQELIKAWFVDKRTLPPTLDALTTPTVYLKTIPEDLFAKGRRIGYRLDDEAGTATIYSVGPDGNDDKGAPLVISPNGNNRLRESMPAMGPGMMPGIMPGMMPGTMPGIMITSSPSSVPQGDISSKITLEDLRNRFPDSTSQTITADFPVPSGNANKDMTKPILTELLKLKERQGGRDNAMIHYVVASWYFPGASNNIINDLMGSTLKKGWSAEAAPLIPTIATYQPMFAEIHKGAALNYACNIGWNLGPATPVPNFLSSQMAGKAMCCEGLYRESTGNYEGAMDDYLTVLTMGRDYGTSGTRLIGAMISCSVENIALQQIQTAATSAPLSSALLTKTLSHMKEAEKGKASFLDVLMGEHEGCGGRILIEARQKLLADPNNEEAIPQELGGGKEFLKNYDKIVAQRLEIARMQRELHYVPYWKRDPQKKQELLDFVEKSEPFVRAAFPNFDEAETRMLTTEAHFGRAEMMLALADYKLANKRFPDKLADLVPKYFAYLPIDPFGGAEFIYIPNAERTAYRLYSIGPDKQNQLGAPRYDATNGTMSAGDVIGGRIR